MIPDLPLAFTLAPRHNYTPEPPERLAEFAAGLVLKRRPRCAETPIYSNLGTRLGYQKTLEDHNLLLDVSEQSALHAAAPAELAGLGG